jgi:molybdopterin molybdotransferase
MIRSGEAQTLIGEIAKKYLKPIVEVVNFKNALHRILAEDLYAVYDQPHFTRVTMDGIAICYQSLKNSNQFHIENIQAAGKTAVKLINGQNCIEVTTGSPLPMGCDTVIPYESINLVGHLATIAATSEISLGQCLHLQGSDYKKDTLLIKKETQMTCGHISIIASSGISKIKVQAHPSIAIVSTGDELIEPGNNLLGHQIFRSNPYAMQAILADHHFFTSSLFHLIDDQDEMRSRLQDILNQHQVIVLSGGVSKGKFDFLPSVLNDLGVKKIFHTVKQRPGKPLYFGIGPQNQLIFGLPGNPVSAVINLRKYVIAALKHCDLPTMYVKTTKDIKFANDMTFFIPATLQFSKDALLLATPLTGNGSGDFFSLRDSNGFIEIDNLENNKIIIAGSIVPFYHWQ